MSDTLVPTSDLPDSSMQQPIPQQATSSMPVPMDDLPAGIPGMQEQHHAPEKHSSLGEMAKAGAEGVARGVLGPFAPGLERDLLQVTKAEQLQRQEENPVSAGVGQAAGLIGGLLTGVGEGAVMSKAGQLGIEAAGLAKPATYLTKIGSSALSNAIEMGVMSGSDEITKAVMNDPTVSSESALANLGMATALGAAGGAFVTGAVSPLWKATMGPKLEGTLANITAKLGGAENMAQKISVTDLESAIGKEFDPAIKAVMDGNPLAARQASILNQTDTAISGRKFQDIIKKTTDDLGDEVATAWERAPSTLDNMKAPDKYNTGKSLTETIHSELKPEIDAISHRYDSLKSPFKKTEIFNSEMQSASDQIAQKAMEEGWMKSGNKHNAAFVKDVLDALPAQKTVQDLDKFISNLRKDNPFTSETYHAAKSMATILRDVQEGAITSRLSPEKLVEYTQTRSAYRQLMEKLEGLDTHLKVGRWEGPESFLSALKEAGDTNGESILRKLNGDNKANVLEVLKAFPKTAEKLRAFHVDELLSDAVGHATSQNLGVKINTTRLMKNFRNLSPQMQEFVATPAQLKKLEAIDTAMNRLKDPTHNWSNTARTVDKHMSSIASPMSLVMELINHGVTGIPLLGYLTRQGLAEGAAATRLSLLKYLGSNSSIDAVGFKAMAQLLGNAAKFGETTVKAVNNVFVPGVKVITATNMPSEADRSKLDGIVDKFSDNQMLAMKLTDSKVGHYLPSHGQEMSNAVTRNVQYLSGLKPHPQHASPLMQDVPVDPMQTARYNRALDIANNPLVVLQHAKDGTVQLTDIQDVKAMYPGVYNQVCQMLTNQLGDHTAKGSEIAYTTRMGCSLLLGQPLDPSMEPNNILAAQPLPKSPDQPGQPIQAKRGTSTLGKSNASYQTPLQAAEKDKGKRD